MQRNRRNEYIGTEGEKEDLEWRPLLFSLLRLLLPMFFHSPGCVIRLDKKVQEKSTVSVGGINIQPRSVILWLYLSAYNLLPSTYKPTSHFFCVMIIIIIISYKRWRTFECKLEHQLNKLLNLHKCIYFLSEDLRNQIRIIITIQGRDM